MRRTLAVLSIVFLASVSPNAFAQEDANPHAGGAASPHGGGGGGPDSDEAPEDGAAEDVTLPKGTIAIQIADASGKPVPNAPVTLGVLYNSVAKGESRKRLTATANAAGVAQFENLDIGSGVAYRPMVIQDGATFSAMPFALGPKNGMRALLHVYPVTSDLEQTLVVSQSLLYAEVKDDRVQIQEVFKIYNFGKNTWVPKDVVIPMPEGFSAFTAQQGMTDVGLDAVGTQGLKLRGTFAPGQHVLEFRWQLPYSGQSEVKFDVGMAPHLAAARVIAPASRSMALEVEGFEAARESKDGTGQRALFTEKQIRREDPPIKSLNVKIKGLPTEGPASILATIVASFSVLVGLVLGARKAPARDAKREREQLLVALEGLELAHRDGSVGPKTYERARRELIDDIARTFTTEPPATRRKGSKKSAPIG